jgi:hypothetical protein
MLARIAPCCSNREPPRLAPSGPRSLQRENKYTRTSIPYLLVFASVPLRASELVPRRGFLGGAMIPCPPLVQAVAFYNAIIQDVTSSLSGSQSIPSFVDYVANAMRMLRKQKKVVQMNRCDVS